MSNISTVKCPLSPPSEMTGVPLSFGNRGQRENHEPQSQSPPVPDSLQKKKPQEEEAQQQGEQPLTSRIEGDYIVRPHIEESCPRTLQLPFSYKARCSVYSIVLVLNIAGCCLAVAMLCSITFMTVKLYQDTTATDGTVTTLRKTIATLTLNGDHFHNVCDDYSGALEDALNWSKTSSEGTICVPGPAGAQIAGVFTIMALVFSVLLATVASVVLGIMRCQRRRARRDVNKDDAQLEHQQVHDAVQRIEVQAASMGRPLYVVVEGARAPLPVTAFNNALQSSTTMAAVHQAEQLSYEARVRYGLGVAALLFSALSLVFTVISLIGGTGSESGVKNQARTASSVDGSVTTRTEVSKAVSSTSVWPNIPNLFIYIVSTVLLAMPSFSGIKDDHQANEAKAVAEAEILHDEEMQLQIHESAAVPREMAEAEAEDNRSEGMQFSEESFFSPDPKKEMNQI